MRPTVVEAGGCRPFQIRRADAASWCSLVASGGLIGFSTICSTFQTFQAMPGASCAPCQTFGLMVAMVEANGG